MKSNATFIAMVLMCFAALISPVNSKAQAGSLDLSFGINGIVTTPIGISNDNGYSVALQSDGKILLAGSSSNASNYDFAIVRYNIDGNLDSSFGSNGKVTTSFGGGGSCIFSIAIQSDGKIIAAGYYGQSPSTYIALARYNTNGSLDSTFDNDGKVTTTIGVNPHEMIRSVAIQGDGKILVAGYSDIGGNYDLALLRYKTNGSLDSTFGSNGKVTTNLGSLDDFGMSLAIQSDGKIVISGCKDFSFFNKAFALVRYNTNGSLDGTFGTNGIVITDIGVNDDYGYSAVIQNDGKIIVGGFSSHDFALVRYNTNGSLDSTFGTNGKVITSFGASSYGLSAAIQSNGKVTLAGFSGSNFALAHYNTNGSLDTSFGINGKVVTSIGNYQDEAWSMAIQNDGKIVVAGYSNNGAKNNFALARYNNDTAFCFPIYFSQSFTVCSGQSVIVGSSTYNISGTYIDTLTSMVNGCDSIVTTILTILAANVYSQSVTVCSGQSIIVGSSTYNISGTYIDTLTSMVNGCDSIVTTILTILAANVYSQSVTVCSGQSIIVGSSTYNISGTYIDTLTSMVNGCDSIVTTILTILAANVYSQSVTVCSGQSVIVGNSTYNISGTYTDTLISTTNGCDSIVTIILTVLPVISYSQSVTVCSGQSVIIGNSTYNISGTYIDTLTSMVNGCDSIVTTFFLVVNSMPIISINFNGATITSDQNNATYQWINCDNGFMPIVGETSQSFSPLSGGNYAVIVTLGVCSDTSLCVNVSTSNISETSFMNSIISIYPNPFNINTIIHTSNLLNDAVINIYNIFGQKVKQISKLSGDKIIFYRDDLENGLYYLQLIEGHNTISRNKISITN